MHPKGTVRTEFLARRQNQLLRPTVVYLAGSGRSGSTLLERALGGSPHVVNVGELIDLFRRVIVTNELCGCGIQFADCPFWSAVGGTFGGWRDGALRELGTLQRAVARQRHVPRHVVPLRSARFTAEADLYRELYRDLYRAILDQSRRSYVVDASKWPAQALALVGPEIDLRIIHVVRDVRGVAHSMHRRNIARPQATTAPEMMAASGTAAAAARWTLCQSEVDLLRLRRVPFTRLSYEDLVDHPRSAIEDALSVLGLPADAGDLDHVGERHIDLRASHGLSGNPSRFQDGRVLIRRDEAWRTQMPWMQQAVVTLLGSPLTLAYRMTSSRQTTSKDGSHGNHN